ncbi:hypothetical protein BDP81DRAFT_439162, partial [Colletotrichum phormii]
MGEFRSSSVTRDYQQMCSGHSTTTTYYGRPQGPGKPWTTETVVVCVQAEEQMRAEEFKFVIRRAI